MNEKRQITLATCLLLLIPLSYALVVGAWIQRIEYEGWRTRAPLFLLLAISVHKISRSLVRRDRNWGDVLGAILLMGLHMALWSIALVLMSK